jgi:transcriptional regulator with XRE-family HTH domain
MAYERINPISAEHQAILNAIGEKVQNLRKKTGLSIERYCVKNDLARISYTNLQSGKNFHMTTLLKVLSVHPDVKSLSQFFSGL